MVEQKTQSMQGSKPAQSETSKQAKTNQLPPSLSANNNNNDTSHTQPQTFKTQHGNHYHYTCRLLQFIHTVIKYQCKIQTCWIAAMII